MKIFINNANENWVVDRFINEWNHYNYRSKKLSYELVIMLEYLLDWIKMVDFLSIAYFWTFPIFHASVFIYTWKMPTQKNDKLTIQ